MVSSLREPLELTGFIIMSVLIAYLGNFVLVLAGILVINFFHTDNVTNGRIIFMWILFSSLIFVPTIVLKLAGYFQRSTHFFILLCSILGAALPIPVILFVPDIQFGVFGSVAVGCYLFSPLCAVFGYFLGGLVINFYHFMSKDE